ncbi:MAG: NAD(P)(+) transhydrogenase (Re/Si-specific) subunit beta [Gammaproteobacteria bacterium]
MTNLEVIIQSAYVVAAILFILGLKRMSSPTTARTGIIWAGVGMLLATAVTFFYPGIENLLLILVAILIGSIIAGITAKKVEMTDMPQMIALYNGMGGGAAAAIAAVELFKGHQLQLSFVILALVGGVIGSISFSGSLIAFGKLQGLIKGSFRFKGQNILNLSILLTATIFSLFIVLGLNYIDNPIVLVFVVALILGVTMTLPIGGADMPVVISLYNALTGLAVGLEGYVLQNYSMIIAGTVVGSAGTLLTQLMAKAMNRSLANVLFSGFGDSGALSSEENTQGEMKPIEANDASIMMAFAQKVIVIPGYGMAVAQAQQKVWEYCQLLIDRGVDVKFAIHPVAGRMPGHMNVLLAEAGVPYDLIYDADEINQEFKSCDVALVIGANDVVNPVARTDPSSPIYGMPILDADYSSNVIVVKRGQGAGFSGIENSLFFLDNTRMLYGDGKDVATDLVQSIKEL